MKHLLAPLLMAVVYCSSCKEYSEETHLKEMDVMKDSIFKAYPTVGAITLNIQDKELFVITLGSKQLAQKDDAARAKMAAELGAMTIRIIGSENSITKEKLIITPDERNEQAEPKDGLVTLFPLDSLKKSSTH